MMAVTVTWLPRLAALGTKYCISAYIEQKGRKTDRWREVSLSKYFNGVFMGRIKQ